MELCSGKLRFLGAPGLGVDIHSIRKHSYRRVCFTGGAAVCAPGNQKELYLGIRARALTLSERFEVDTQITALKLAALCFLSFWK